METTRDERAAWAARCVEGRAGDGFLGRLIRDVNALEKLLARHAGQPEESLYGLVSEHAERLEQQGKPDNAVGWRWQAQRIWRNLQDARAVLAPKGAPVADAPAGLSYEEMSAALQDAERKHAEAVGQMVILGRQIERLLLFIENRDAFEGRYGGPKHPESSLSVEFWLDIEVYGPARTALRMAHG